MKMNSLLCEISLNSSPFILNNTYKSSVSKKHECRECVCISADGCAHTLLDFGNELLGGKVISYRTCGAKEKR